MRPATWFMCGVCCAFGAGVLLYGWRGAFAAVAIYVSINALAYSILCELKLM